MTTARIIKSGKSQAIRLPREFRFSATEVEIFRRGDEVILREKTTKSPAEVFRLLASLPDDFMADGRQDEPPEDRGRASVAPHHLRAQKPAETTLEGSLDGSHLKATS